MLRWLVDKTISLDDCTTESEVLKKTMKYAYNMGGIVGFVIGFIAGAVLL